MLVLLFAVCWLVLLLFLAVVVVVGFIANPAGVVVVGG